MFGVSLLIYRANDGFLYTYDSAPASLFVFNLLAHHTLFFDAYRGGYLYDLGAGYAFVQRPDGHVVSLFPIGTALLTAPIFAFDWLRATATGPFPDTTALAFEATRLAYEKDAATLIGASAAVVFYLCARLLATLPVALGATLAFAFGTEMWTVGSQALWQHGAINLMTLTMTYALLREGRSTRRPRAIAWLCAAGAAAGFLPVVRPTAAAFALAGLAYVLVARRRDTWAFGVGAAAGVSPGLVWNWVAFHSVVGGYATIADSYAFAPGPAARALAGLLVSPSKGLLIYTPFVAVSLVGAVRAARSGTRDGLLLTALAWAGLATVLNYAFFSRWIGGTCYGPRYLTDISSVVALLLIGALPVRRGARYPNRYAVGALALLVAYGVAVQAAGANGEPKSNWSGIPLDDGLHPERVWRLADSQIQRDALTAYRLHRANPTFVPAYAGAFGGRVLDVRPLGGGTALHVLALRPGETIDLAASARNDGQTRWYGYDTGFYFGQTRVRVRVYTSSGVEVAQAYLYFSGYPASGARAEAIGSLHAPRAPGTYAAAFDVDAFQIPLRDRPRDPPLRIPLAVR